MQTRSQAHPSADTLKAYANAKLSESAAGEVWAHLEECEACRQALTALSGDGFLKRLRAAQSSGGSGLSAPSLSQAGNTGHSLSLPATGSYRPADVPAELQNHPHYEVVGELGRGGMGVVYLAKNRLMDRPEVLKVVNERLLEAAGGRERFLREVQAAARLNHPNVVTAYSAMPLGGLLVFAMEYVDGKDLARVVAAQGPLPVPHACYYVQQAALGLQHAFEKGMVHRDIKPQNLILAKDGKRHRVKVLDFGLAKVMRERAETGGLTGSGQLLGTPDYIAPEQSLDAAHADIRADVYSLGCTLYFLLTGSPPFARKSLYEILQAHQSEAARSLNIVRTDVPVELAAVVAKMMAKDPDRRFQTPAEAAVVLTPFIKKGLEAGPAKGGSVAKPTPGSTSRPGVASPASPAAETNSRPASDTMRERPEAPADPWQGMSVVGEKAPPKQPAARRRWLVGGMVGIAALLVGLSALWAAGVFKIKTPHGILVVEVNEPGAELFWGGENLQVAWEAGGKKAEIRVVPGKRKLEVRKDGFKVYGEEVTVEDGGRTTFRVSLEPLPAPVPRQATPQIANTPTVGPEIPPASKPALKPVPPKQDDLDCAGNPYPGTWLIKDQELVQTDPRCSVAIIQFGDQTWTDYDYSVEALKETAGDAWFSFHFRSKDDANTYRFPVGCGSVAGPINRFQNGAMEALNKSDRFVLEANKWYRILIKVRGDRLEGYINGTRYAAVLDGTHRTGKVGLMTVNAACRFKKITVTDPDGKTLWSGPAKTSPASPATENRQVADANPVSGSGKAVFTPTLIFLLAGQSNMVGLGDKASLPANYKEMPDNVMVWENGKWVSLLNAGQTFGPEIGFAHTIAKALPTERIGIVKFAKGGTGIDEWSPSGDKSLYRELMRQVAAARKTAPAAYLGAMLWMQGERDSCEANLAASYAVKLSQLVEGARKDTDTEDMAFLCGQVNPLYPHVKAVRAAQAALPNRLARTALVSTDGLQKAPDQLHYNTEGQLGLGIRFADTFLKLAGSDRKVKTQSPQGQLIEQGIPAFVHGGGNWHVHSGVLIQDNPSPDITFLVFGDPRWKDYDVTVEGQRTDGKGSWCLLFRVGDVLNYWGYLSGVTRQGLFTRVDGIVKYPLTFSNLANDQAWHRLKIQVRGDRITGRWDNGQAFAIEDSRHPRGSFALVSQRSRMGFRNLKISDSHGRMLVESVNQLKVAAPQRFEATSDRFQPGTHWRGKLRQNENGVDRFEADLVIKVKNRDKDRFDGELWISNETRGMKIAGNLDQYGNVTWRCTAFLAGTWLPDNLDTIVIGTISGSRLRAYASFPAHTLIAEMSAIRD